MLTRLTLGFAPLLLGVSLASLAPASALPAQEPVNRPTPTPRTGAGLPAPRNIVATQEADGRIRVVWNAVPGATGYSVVRSVPPAAAKQMLPNPTSPLFVDSDVVAGSLHYYQIAAIDETGRIGLKAGTAPVRARSAMSAGGSPAPAAPTRVVATLTPAGLADVEWYFAPREGLAFLVEKTHPFVESEWQVVGQTPTLTSFTSSRSGWGSIPGLQQGKRVSFRVTAIDVATGARSAPTRSNELLVPAATVPGTPATGTTAASAVGAITVSMAAPLTVGRGGTVSLVPALAGASASRWVSLDEAVATVDGSGTVTGLAQGRAQILAIGRGADGSARVTLAVVTVAP